MLMPNLPLVGKRQSRKKPLSMIRMQMSPKKIRRSLGSKVKLLGLRIWFLLILLAKCHGLHFIMLCNIPTFLRYSWLHVISLSFSWNFIFIQLKLFILSHLSCFLVWFLLCASSFQHSFSHLFIFLMNNPSTMTHFRSWKVLCWNIRGLNVEKNGMQFVIK